MNYSSYINLVGWETRNWRHRDRALIWCKDYGLKPVTKNVFIGELYSKERKELEAKFKQLFRSKTEKFFFAGMCKSCFNMSMTDVRRETYANHTDHFELVQMSEKA